MHFEILVAGTELRFPLAPRLLLIGRREAGARVTDVDDPRVHDLNAERVRHAHRFLFSSSEEAAEWALRLYGDLRARGEAHATPMSFVILTERGPRVVR